MNQKYSIRISKFKSYIPYILSIVFMAMLFSCVDEIDIKLQTPEEKTGTLTIYIPDVKGAAEFGATRNDEFQKSRAVMEAEEGKISELWIFAYPVEDNSTRKPVISNINLSDNYLNDTYKSAIVTGFKVGKYRIYFLANIKKYLDDSIKIESISEENLKNLILNFSSENFLEIGNLPMYCLPDEVKVSPNQPVNDGIFNYSPTGNSLYADLTFMCSKVRYTVLYDKSSFSSDITASEVNFSKAKAGNVLSEAALIPTENYSYGPTDFFELSPLKFNDVSYPEDGSPYFNIKDAQTPPADLDPIEDQGNKDKRAWQGTVYLTENKDSKNLTKISLTPSGNGMNETYYFNPRALERGKMYDLVAKIQNIEIEELEPEVNIEDWNLSTLSYILHGPYELIVKKTKIGIVSGEYTTLGYSSNTTIDFEFPTVSYTPASSGESIEIPFYVAEIITKDITDNDGNAYLFDDDFPNHFRISINPDVPFSVLYNMEHEDNGAAKDAVRYFHVVAGNIHKKIEIDPLDLSASLSVTPRTIVIETREYYLSGKSGDEIPITFHTNYDDTNDEVSFTLTGHNELVSGLGDNDLKLILCEGIDENGNISVTNGTLSLKINNIFEGHAFWTQENEYLLTFTLNIPKSNKVLTQTVKIIVKPFTTNYVIHFRDNTKEWSKPHIFVYQDLLLPSDLTSGKNKNGVTVNATPYAGKIVGYVEYNNGQQWNAAAQYVFSNNISFTGWYGYGGPEINDPYDLYTSSLSSANYNRMGFVMLGEPKEIDADLGKTWVWNDDYGYTNRNDDNIRHERYRYDVNFNEDHATRIRDKSQWNNCNSCATNYYAGSKFAGTNNDDYDYPGIVMEYEGDGWWKYTLSGVAQPGLTMISFADTHEPWAKDTRFLNYAMEDFRFPPEYESGIQLFDFVDNEGWLLFDGNTSNKNQNFSATKPTNVIPHQFTLEMVTNMRIDFEKPVNFSQIEVFDENWNNKIVANVLSDNNGENYILVNNSIYSDNKKIIIQINNTDNSQLQYELAPKNFVNKNGTYVLADRLRLKFEDGMKFFIKWNDKIKFEKSAYQPREGGCEYLNIYANELNDNYFCQYAKCLEKDEIGNYKHVDITLENTDNNPNKLILQLATGFNFNNGYASRDLYIQDIPKFYNPSTGKYHINWHMLEEIKWW